jgi:hypothetical protein
MTKENEAFQRLVGMNPFENAPWEFTLALADVFSEAEEASDQSRMTKEGTWRTADRPNDKPWEPVLDLRKRPDGVWELQE